MQSEEGSTGRGSDEAIVSADSQAAVMHGATEQDRSDEVGHAPAADTKVAQPKPHTSRIDVDDFPGGLKACLEAILMAADQPQTAQDFARILSAGVEEIEETLLCMQKEYEGTSVDGDDGAALPEMRGFELRKTARGWQYASRAEYEQVVSAFITDGQNARLSQAALEALAIIAYKQPMTRAQVAAIRGVNSDGVIRSLMVRGLIRECGVDEETRAALLGTSELFLDYMGIASVEELPSLAPMLPDSNDMRNGMSPDMP